MKNRLNSGVLFFFFVPKPAVIQTTSSVGMKTCLFRFSLKRSLGEKWRENVSEKQNFKFCFFFEKSFQVSFEKKKI